MAEARAWQGLSERWLGRRYARLDELPLVRALVVGHDGPDDAGMRGLSIDIGPAGGDYGAFELTSQFGFFAWGAAIVQMSASVLSMRVTREPRPAGAVVAGTVSSLYDDVRDVVGVGYTAAGPAPVGLYISTNLVGGLALARPIVVPPGFALVAYTNAAVGASSLTLSVLFEEGG